MKTESKSTSLSPPPPTGGNGLFRLTDTENLQWIWEETENSQCHWSRSMWINYDSSDFFKVARAQGNQGIWMFIFLDREFAKKY